MAEDDQPTEDAFDALLRQTLHGALDAVPVPADWPALAARLAAHRPPQVATTPRSAGPRPRWLLRTLHTARQGKVRRGVDDEAHQFSRLEGP